MAMQVRVTLPYTTGIPRDVAVNTFTVIGDVAVDPEALLAAVEGFYNDTPTGADVAVGGYLSRIITRATNGILVEAMAIDLVTGELTPPSEVGRFTLVNAAGGVGSLPFEVALCTSIRHDGGPAPIARRSGRMYIGPLNISAAATADEWGAPRADLIDSLVGATAYLATALNDVVGAPLGIWSRTDHAVYNVTSGWVDNEFDTQRRREVDATSRQTWTLTP